MSFKDDIEAEANGEPIETIIIGKMGDYRNDRRDMGVPIGFPIRWDVAAQFLDYDYDPGYGMPDCHPIFAYTKS